MFRDARNLERLDLSSFDTRNVEDMRSMFLGLTRLREIRLGSNFVFVDATNLPRPEPTPGFTGRWQNVGGGTVEAPQGGYVLTNAQLVALGSRPADTWVWQPAP